MVNGIYQCINYFFVHLNAYHANCTKMNIIKNTQHTIKSSTIYIWNVCMRIYKRT